MAWSNALRKRYTCVTKRFGCPPLPTRQNISVLLSDGLDGWLWQPLFYCNLNYPSALFKGLNNLSVFSWLPTNKWIGMRFLCFCIHAEMISLIKGTLNERTYLINFSDSNWAVLSLIISQQWVRRSRYLLRGSWSSSASFWCFYLWSSLTQTKTRQRAFLRHLAALQLILKKTFQKRKGFLLTERILKWKNY